MLNSKLLNFEAPKLLNCETQTPKPFTPKAKPPAGRRGVEEAGGVAVARQRSHEVKEAAA